MPAFESADALRRHYAAVRARLGGPEKRMYVPSPTVKIIPQPAPRLPKIMVRPPRPVRPARPVRPNPPKPKIKPTPETVAQEAPNPEQIVIEPGASGPRWMLLEIGRASPRKAIDAICRFFGVRPHMLRLGRFGEPTNRGRSKFIRAVVVTYLKLVHRRSDSEVAAAFNLKAETVAEITKETEELFAKVYPRSNLFIFQWLTRLHKAATRDAKGCLTVSQSEAAPDARTD